MFNHLKWNSSKDALFSLLYSKNCEIDDWSSECTGSNSSSCRTTWTLVKTILVTTSIYLTWICSTRQLVFYKTTRGQKDECNMRLISVIRFIESTHYQKEHRSKQIFKRNRSDCISAEKNVLRRFWSIDWISKRTLPSRDLL